MEPDYNDPTNQIIDEMIAESKCTIGECPFYQNATSKQWWGMSPEGWAAAERNHKDNHQGKSTESNPYTDSNPWMDAYATQCLETERKRIHAALDKTLKDDEFRVRTETTGKEYSLITYENLDSILDKVILGNRK